MFCDSVHSHSTKNREGFRKCDRPDDVRASGFFFLREASPLNVIGTDIGNSSTSDNIRLTRCKKILRSDKNADAEWRVDFVRRVRKEIDVAGIVVRQNVDRAV